ncbi:hypothetical protein V3C99_016531 [Haemonchus contortus]
MLVARCAQRLSWLIHRRNISLTNNSSSVWRNAWKRVKGFLTQSEKENFDEDLVRKAYRSDDLKEDEWLLIYRDQGASQSFFLFATAFPIFVIGLGVVGYDIYTNEERDRFHFVQRLLRDIDEVGIFVVVPATAAVLVILTLLRVHQLRIMRIYQNRKSADDYLAIGSRNVVQKHLIHFNRNCASACYFAEEQTDYARLFSHVFLGNMQVENRRFFISDDGFRANNYRTYMLNETSIPPRL